MHRPRVATASLPARPPLLSAIQPFPSSPVPTLPCRRLSHQATKQGLAASPENWREGEACRSPVGTHHRRREIVARSPSEGRAQDKTQIAEHHCLKNTIAKLPGEAICSAISAAPLPRVHYRCSCMCAFFKAHIFRHRSTPASCDPPFFGPRPSIHPFYVRDGPSLSL